MDRLFKSLVAGFAGAMAHLALSFARTRLGILPDFQPYDEMQRGLKALTGETVSAPVAYALTFLNGAVVWSFVFARLFRWLPGGTPLRKGATFAVAAWAVSGLVIFPVLGRGPFAWRLGLGPWPAALMLVMLTAYSCVMSYAWWALTSDDPARRP